MPKERRAVIDYRDLEESETVEFDFDSMSEFDKAEFGQGALEAFLRFLTRPDARAILDRERELLRLEGSTLLDDVPRKKKGANT